MIDVLFPYVLNLFSVAPRFPLIFFVLPSHSTECVVSYISNMKYVVTPFKHLMTTCCAHFVQRLLLKLVVQILLNFFYVMRWA
jgi:hypothetical protein